MCMRNNITPSDPNRTRTFWKINDRSETAAEPDITDVVPVMTNDA